MAVPLWSQEASDSDRTPPSLAQEKAREWVEVQKTISAEESAWVQEKQEVQDLMELRRKEIAQLDEVIAAAGTRLRDAEEQRTALLAEEKELRTERQLLQQRIKEMESRIRALEPSFPPPLRNKVADALERLEVTDSSLPLQNRYRDVLAILTEAGNFQNQITVDSEMRELGDEQVEVQVFYLGLGQAYYTDRSGRHAGHGVPTTEGWSWTEDPSLSSRIRKAIAVHQKQAPAELVRLPLEIK